MIALLFVLRRKHVAKGREQLLRVEAIPCTAGVSCICSLRGIVPSLGVEPPQQSTCRSGESYETFLRGLAVACGIPTPTRAELTRCACSRPEPIHDSLARPLSRFGRAGTEALSVLIPWRCCMKTLRGAHFS